MKRINKIAIIITAVVLSFITIMFFINLISANNVDSKDKVLKNGLSLNQIDEIKAIIEEEKLARDIYSEFYRLHSEGIFLEISKDEQKHMDRILTLVDIYKFEDPVKTNPPGVFSDPNVQVLYNQLLLEGTKSLEDALKVAIKLEKIDKEDISKTKSKTSALSSIDTFDFLMTGSKYHLDKYTKYLNALQTKNEFSKFNVFNDTKEVSGNFKILNNEGNSILLENKQWGFSQLIFKNKQLKKTKIKFDLELANLSITNLNYVIFDYKNPMDFKYVGLRLDQEYWTIGQYYNKSWKNSIIKREIIKPQNNFSVEVEIDGGIVTLIVDNKLKLKKSFPIIFDNSLGLGVYRSSAKFKNIEINYEKSNYTSKILNVYNLKLSTTSGLNKMVDIILNDEGLNKKIPRIDIMEAAYYADKMNKILIDSISHLGIYDDNTLTPAEVVTLNKYVFDNYYDEWKIYHGNDENGFESGFHLVQNDGATTRLYNQNAVNTVIDGILHLGFEPRSRNNAVNEDMNNNQKYKDLANWLNELLKYDSNKNTLKSTTYLTNQKAPTNYFEKVAGFFS